MALISLKGFFESSLSGEGSVMFSRACVSFKQAICRKINLKKNISRRLT